MAVDTNGLSGVLCSIHSRTLRHRLLADEPLGFDFVRMAVYVEGDEVKSFMIQDEGKFLFPGEIVSMYDLQLAVLSGVTDWTPYGEVNATYHEGMVLFNYKATAQYANRWNWFELNSRGLILDTLTGEVVARPFPKFFNWGEGGRSSTADIVSATEKMDGSLGILYRHKGQYAIATRGSFISEQAVWATKQLQQHDLTGLPDSFTLLFEIIYPENRIVVDYQGWAGLVLLGMTDRHTGGEASFVITQICAARYGFRTPKYYDFSRGSMAEILQYASALDANREGFVLHFADGQRFKVKGEAYKLAHRIMTQVTFRRVLEAVEAGTFDAMIEGVPDEFLGQVKVWRNEIERTIDFVIVTVANALLDAPKDCTQKEFALWVQAHYQKEMQSYLFAARAGKQIKPMIYRKAFENRLLFDKPLVEEI